MTSKILCSSGDVIIYEASVDSFVCSECGYFDIDYGDDSGVFNVQVNAEIHLKYHTDCPAGFRVGKHGTLNTSCYYKCDQCNHFCYTKEQCVGHVKLVHTLKQYGFRCPTQIGRADVADWVFCGICQDYKLTGRHDDIPLLERFTDVDIAMKHIALHEKINEHVNFFVVRGIAVYCTCCGLDFATVQEAITHRELMHEKKYPIFNPTTKRCSWCGYKCLAKERPAHLVTCGHEFSMHRVMPTFVLGLISEKSPVSFANSDVAKAIAQFL